MSVIEVHGTSPSEAANREIRRHVCILPRDPEVRSSGFHPRKYRGADDGREMLPTNIPQLTAQQSPSTPMESS